MLVTEPRFRLQKGTSLLEVLVAVLVLSVGLIGALKMQSEAVRQNANSRYVSLAGLHAMQIMEELKSGNTVASDCKALTADLPKSSCAITTSGTRAEITIKWTPPGTDKEEGASYAVDTRS